MAWYRIGYKKLSLFRFTPKYIVTASYSLMVGGGFESPARHTAISNRFFLPYQNSGEIFESTPSSS
jgi:hypothetical protein